MTVGLSVNNPFNLEANDKIDWKGEVKPSASPPFCQFQTIVLGLRAGFLDLVNQQRIHGRRTWNDIIPIYAPPSENDTQAYIDDMCRGTQTTAVQPLQLTNQAFLIMAGRVMIHHEQGCNPCTDAQLTQAASLALSTSTGGIT